MMKVTHTIGPYYNEDSEILILGSMPSVKSRELNFYYMHSQNRFWNILEDVYNESIGSKIKDKKLFLKKHKIALWDVIKSCEIEGSADNTITNVIVNDIDILIKRTNIRRIFVTGRKAYNLYNKYCYPKTMIKATYLYSSSRANASIPYKRIVENYQVINKY